MPTSRMLAGKNSFSKNVHLILKGISCSMAQSKSPSAKISAVLWMKAWEAG